MATTKTKKYRYVMHVTETVEYTTAVESERKMDFNELAEETEDRRVKGTLSFKCVSNVETYCEAAYAGRRKDRDAIAH